MATRKPLFNASSSDFGSEEMAATDDIALGGLAMSNDITMGGNELTGLGLVPGTASTAASKSYVDSVAAGLSIRTAVKLATAAALPANTAAGAGVGKTLTANANGILTVDGVASVLADYILVKDESVGVDIDHGVYEVTTEGTAGVPFVLTRRTDLDEDSEMLDGITVWIGQGSTNSDTRWTVITNDPITVDTTAIQWDQTAGPGVLTGGDGIAINSGAIEVDLDTNSGLEINSTKLRVDVASSDELSLSAAGLNVEGVPTLFKIGATAVGSNVTSVNLDALTGGSETALHSHAGSDATRLEAELTALETLTKGDPIEWSATNDRIRQVRANAGARVDVFGVVEESAGIAAAATGTIVRRGIAVGVIAAATAGNRYYAADAGGLVQGTAGIAAGNHVVFIGTAVNATDLEVNPQYITKKAA